MTLELQQEASSLQEKYACIGCANRDTEGGTSILLARLVTPMQWSWLRVCGACAPQFVERASAIYESLRTRHKGDDLRRPTHFGLFEIIEPGKNEKNPHAGFMCEFCFNRLVVELKGLCVDVAAERGAQAVLTHFPAERWDQQGESNEHDDRE